MKKQPEPVTPASEAPAPTVPARPPILAPDGGAYFIGADGKMVPQPPETE